MEEGDKKNYLDVLCIINEKKLNSLVTEDIIKRNNWKFKNPTEKGNNNNKFSWKELAEMSKIPSRFATFYQDYASDFVHGIGSSPIIDEKNVDQIIGETLKFSSVLMYLIIKIVFNEFEEGVKFTEINSMIKEKSDYLWNKKN